MFKQVFCSVLLCIVVSSCSKKETDVAIKVNGTLISKQDVKQATEILRESMERAYPEKALEGMPDLSKEAAHQLVANEVMIAEAKKRNIAISSNLIDSVFNSFKSRFQDSTQFKAQLTAMGEDEKSIRAEMEKGALLDSLLKQILVGVDSASELECQEFYSKNSSKYVGRPRVRASQIFFAADSTKDKKLWAESKKKADEALSQLRAGKKFEDVVMKYTKDNLKGDIGWFNKGDLRPDLENPISALKKGEISDIVCTNVGFHILMKTDEDSAKTLPYEEVKTHVQMMVNMKKRNDIMTNFVDSLTAKAKIVYVDTALTPVPQKK